jgi:hypothetical protein
MFKTLTNLAVIKGRFMSKEKDYEDMTDEEREQHEIDNLPDEYYKTQNEMDSPTGEDD